MITCTFPTDSRQRWFTYQDQTCASTNVCQINQPWKSKKNNQFLPCKTQNYWRICQIHQSWDGGLIDNLVYHNYRTRHVSKTCTSLRWGYPNTTEIWPHWTPLCGDNTKSWSRWTDVCSITDLPDKIMSFPAPQLLTIHASRHLNFTWTPSIRDTHPQTLNSSTKYKFRAT